MNIYIVIEGEIAASKIYQSWIPFVNPHLNYANHISGVIHNNFAILMGGGQPGILKRIDNAIKDVNNHNNIDRLIIALDSENCTFDQRHAWVNNHVLGKTCTAEIYIVVQHFCLETWALGNVTIISANPQDSKLRDYKNFYDVRTKDPELLPPYSKEDINRAQLAEKYLRRALIDISNNQITYTKSNSNALLDFNYFNQLKQRLKQTNHIPSFKGFLDAFI